MPEYWELNITADEYLHVDVYKSKTGFTVSDRDSDYTPTVYLTPTELRDLHAKLGERLAELEG